jgi:hypothetical protein
MRDFIHEAELKSRIRYARKWRARRMYVKQKTDDLFYFFLGQDFQLPHNSKWALFAEFFWTDCPICFFYRGAVGGFLLALLLSVMVFLFVR